jgi:alcohol dehydrogenase class IV
MSAELGSNFAFHTPAEILCEPGVIGKVAELHALTGARRVLVITDKSLSALGFAAKVTDALQADGKQAVVFDAVEAEPSFATTRAAVEFGRSNDVDAVIGLGGGSPMDVAKLVSLLIPSPQDLAGIVGVDRATGARLPLVLVPTTAGTGSEVTKVAVVTADDGDKSPILAPQLYCDSVLLDVELTLGLPPKNTADTGVDAMVHAIEAYTSRVRKNPVSDQLAVKALQLLFPNVLLAVKSGDQMAPRQAMLTGSMLAGLAFANASVGAVHALAYAIGALFKVSHGASNAAVLPAVMRFNLPDAMPLYAQLGRTLLPELSSQSDQEVADQFIAVLEQRITDVGLTTSLRDFGIQATDLPQLVDAAARQERLLSYNARSMLPSDIEGVFRSIL